jgi:uncharacterized protein involved in outer membrane biogenesis
MDITMKFVRIFLSLIGLLAVIGVIIVAGLVLFIDPNKLKPVIAEEVLKDTGYQLTIEGPLTWAFYPRLGVHIDKMTLRAPNQTAPFDECRNVSLATRLMDLLSGNEKLQGSVRIGALRLMQVEAENAFVGVHWHKKVLTLEPLQATFYGGTLTGTLAATNLSTQPFWNINLQLNQVQLKPLLQDLNGPNTKINISAISDMKWVSTTTGMTREHWLKNLNGTLAVHLTNGAVEGIDFNYLVNAANDLIHARMVAMPPATQITYFQSLSSSFVIKNGVLETDNLLLESPAFTTKGAGHMDLLAERIDYQLQITPRHEDAIHWAVPVLVSGNWRDPSVNLDKIALEKLVVQEQVQQVKAKVQDEVKKLPDKANKLIQRLINH